MPLPAALDHAVNALDATSLPSSFGALGAAAPTTQAAPAAQAAATPAATMSAATRRGDQEGR
jgi:hypothetical protein